MVTKVFLIQAVCIHSGRRGKSHGECDLALIDPAQQDSKW